MDGETEAASGDGKNVDLEGDRAGCKPGSPVLAVVTQDDSRYWGCPVGAQAYRQG